MWTTTKLNAFYVIKIYKKKPQFFFQKEGHAPDAPALDPPLLYNFSTLLNGYKRKNFIVIDRL